MWRGPSGRPRRTRRRSRAAQAEDDDGRVADEKRAADADDTPSKLAAVGNDTPSKLAAAGAREPSASLEFAGSDLDESCPRLREGDRVAFDIVEHRFTGERRAAGIRFVSRAPAAKPSAARAAPAVADPEGDEAELGRVEKITGRYGFIRKIGGRLEALRERDKAEKKSEADGLESAGAPPLALLLPCRLSLEDPARVFSLLQLGPRDARGGPSRGLGGVLHSATRGRDGKPTATRVSIAPRSARGRSSARKRRWRRRGSRRRRLARPRRWGKSAAAADAPNPARNAAW